MPILVKKTTFGDIVNLPHICRNGCMAGWGIFSDAGVIMQQTKFVELLPIEDTFVTALGKIEFPEPGWIRSYLYAKEGGVLVLKTRLVIPLTRAIEMNGRAADELAAEFRKLNPLRLVT